MGGRRALPSGAVVSAPRPTVAQHGCLPGYRQRQIAHITHTYNVLAKVLRWGNSLGIRISKADAEREGLLPGQEVEVQVRPRVKKAAFDWSKAPSFDLGGLADRHDEVDWQ